MSSRDFPASLAARRSHTGRPSIDPALMIRMLIVGYVFAIRSERWTSSATRPEPKNSQNAQRNYERYQVLARTEAQIGNTVGAENYYQHAEHYFRSMRSDSEGT